MSISGLHVTMFAWAAALLVGTLWRRSQRLCLVWPAQHAALVGGVLLAAGYALFSGWGVPSQRTIWMLAAVGLLRLSGRRWPWPQVWLLAELRGGGRAVRDRPGPARGRGGQYGQARNGKRWRDVA